MFSLNARKVPVSPMTIAVSQHEEQRQRYDTKLKRELGDLLLSHLADPRTEDILLNPDSVLWIKRLGESFSQIGEMPPSQATSALNTIAAWKGTSVNHEHPVIETELPLDGSRFEGLVSPVVRNPVFAVRLKPRKIFTIEDYEHSGILTHKEDPLNKFRFRDSFLSTIRGLSHAEIIRKAISAKRNILIVGATGSGKTTFLNACLAAMSRLAPNDRVISIQDTAELQCSVKNYVDLQTAGNVTMLDCLRACLRLKPTRIVVGEVRGGEAHVLLKSWNTGHPGGIATIHANDALSGLARLETLVAEATTAPQQNLIAEAVDVVVFVDEESGIAAGRKVREIVCVTGYEGGRYVTEHV
jgi:type IV secretion system protein TrbB